MIIRVKLPLGLFFCSNEWYEPCDLEKIFQIPGIEHKIPANTSGQIDFAKLFEFIGF